MFKKLRSAKALTMATNNFDCLSCGACCVEAGYVPVEPSDCIPEELTDRHWKSNRLKLKQYLGGRCKQLEGVIGSCVSCKIYDIRPKTCRVFTPGSSGCIEARAAMKRKMSDPELIALRPRGYGKDWEETV